MKEWEKSKGVMELKSKYKASLFSKGKTGGSKKCKFSSTGPNLQQSTKANNKALATTDQVGGIVFKGQRRSIAMKGVADLAGGMMNACCPLMTDASITSSFLWLFPGPAPVHPHLFCTGKPRAGPVLQLWSHQP